jgi:hypothetical protein
MNDVIGTLLGAYAGWILGKHIIGPWLEKKLRKK